MAGKKGGKKEIGEKICSEARPCFTITCPNTRTLFVRVSTLFCRLQSYTTLHCGDTQPKAVG
jgi:hypothetical protein